MSSLSNTPRGYPEVLPLLTFTFPNNSRPQEGEFRRHYIDSDLRQINAITYFALFLMLALSILDAVRLEERPGLAQGLVLRTIMMMAGVGVVWFTRIRQEPWVVDATAVFYSTLITILIFLFHTTGEASIVRMGCIVTLYIFVVHLAFPTYAIFMLTPIVALISGDAYLYYTLDRPDFVEGRSVVLITNVISLCIAVIGSALLQRSRYEAFQALRRVKRLSGMLPICSSCKKIRNDQGLYQQIERYIEDHSDAEFSHGLCPECARLMYPGYLRTSETR